MFNSVFKIAYLIEFITVFIIRKNSERKYPKQGIKIRKKNLFDLILLILNGIGMIIPLVYIFSTWLDFANYALPVWIGWTGVALFAVAIWMLWKSHHDLGHNWTPVVGVRHDAGLVTNGIYKYIRHPMYAAHLIWAIAQILILHNWIAGYSFLIVQIPFYFVRISSEEQFMIDQFGEEYKSYMKTTRRLIPWLM